MARIEATVTMKGIYSYSAPAYGYGMETRYIYNMEAEDGTVYVWKTTKFMGFYVECADGHFCNSKGVWCEFYRVNKGDIIRIKATVKGQSEYKGQPQTEVNRVTVLERIFRAETWEEAQERKEKEKRRKAGEQWDSLQDDDFIWRMPYRQYKEHYSDCETVVGSYKGPEKYGRIPATIEVIVREGRLKNSGVRGEHYSGYKLENKDGEHVVYRAVKEENAIRRAEKEYGGEWKCVYIYEYK